MGTMNFLLPAELPPGAAEELERACVAGGPDNMPWPTEVRIEPGRLSLDRDVDESGCLVVPWNVNGFGRLMGTSGTLVERTQPYNFQIELARGKINQLRCQSADWQAGGLQVSPELLQSIRTASLAFGKAVTQPLSHEVERLAQAALVEGYQTADQLVKLYVDQMFHARHQRHPRLDTTLGCSLGGTALTKDQAETLIQTCNSVSLRFSWNEVQQEENRFCWETYDALLEWAQEQGLIVTGGPLIDFSAAQLPDWLWKKERNKSNLATLLCNYVEEAVRRYQGRIRVWQLTTASNCAAVLSLSEDELLWLTVQLAESARQVDTNLALVVGISQPWGDYMAVEDRTHSPFIFADTLIRSGLNLGALDLELVMGVTPRGSYCRDLLDTSRMLDLYTLLGVPLRVTLAYPSADASDPNTSEAITVAAGSWHKSFSGEEQAFWATHFAALAMCKPSVRGILWPQLSDAIPHQFPHCGLFDAQNRPKPVLQHLQELRENHLR